MGAQCCQSAGPEPGSIIYLDNAATTPVDPCVVKAMLPYLTTKFGNPSAITYAQGWEAKAAIEQARHEVAELFGAGHDNEVIFTSGATEANAIAIVGSMTSAGIDAKPHIVTSQLEHSCVLQSCRRLERLGQASVTYLGLSNRDGVTRAAEVKAALRPNTALVSIMLANNEIGVVNDIKGIAEVVAAHNGGATLLHVDGAQGIGKVPFSVKDHHIHLMSVSAHKWYGPKGVGALYIRRDVQDRLDAVVKGGGQEFGFRGGTQNVAGIVGMGCAAKLVKEGLEEEGKRIAELRDHALKRLRSELPAECPAHVTASMTERVPSNLHFAVPGCNAEDLLARVRKHVAFSSGSACAAAAESKGHVMSALGVPPEWPIFRLGFGRFTTRQETDQAIDVIVAAIKENFGTVEGVDAKELGPLAPTLEPAPEIANSDGGRKGSKMAQPSALDKLGASEDQVSSGMVVVGVVQNKHQEPTYIEWKHERSVIQVDKKWKGALDGLEKWTHLHILWVMGQEKSTKTSHVPQALYGEVPKVGIFACRCPQRPNKIAMSLVKLISVDTATLKVTVEGLDAINGSPVLDIKPYVAELDEFAKVRGRDSVLGQPEWNSKLQY